MVSAMTTLADRTYVVTGGNTGIGRITALELARQGARVLVASRSRDKTEPVVAELRREAHNERVEYVPLDLADLSSVRACADALLARDLPLHGLVNNAGVGGQRGVTKDGFELHFGINHLGHYLLTRLLLERLRETAAAHGEARIVNVSSTMHYRAKGIDWDAVRGPTRSFTGTREYAVSKLANVLFTKELARRLATVPGAARVTTYAVHPGGVATDIYRRIPQPFRWALLKFLITPEEGAVASLRCATDPALAGQTGRYYDVGGVERTPHRRAEDPELAAALWTKSAEWVGLPA